MHRLILAAILLLSLSAVAQTTTTYNVVTPYGGGVVTTPYRVFSINLSDDNGIAAQIPWLEVGANTSCDNPTSPRLGFLFINSPAPSITESQCATVLTAADNSVTFTVSDDNGNPVSGSFTWTQHAACHRTSGRVSRTVCSYVTDSGTLTLTE